MWSPSDTRVGRSSHSRLDLEKQFRWSAYSIGVECEICLSSPTIADCLTFSLSCCRRCLEGDWVEDGGSGLFECKACNGVVRDSEGL